ncbi:MAG TPA: carbohydrate binding domain-containing protein [Opitutaceae bacterium]|nr:carbohydrate binding domain-containing protein [Opitutaceae bacterium]
MLRSNALRCVPLLTALASPLAFAAAEDTSGWTPWPYVEPVPGSALDLSALNGAEPAGAHGRIVVRNGHFATAADGKRIRFWGCNLSSEQNFLSAAEAETLARRLALGGVNIARLHHMDNPWSAASGGSIWSKDRPDRTRIDPAQLDKLHRLVAALKARGIYSNINLKVSKTLVPEDGFPASVAQTPPFQKQVDYFQRRMVELQRDYARQLLTAKNPYTGLSLAEDPAVAVVEINNENSLLGQRTRDIGRRLEQLLPEPFRTELAQLWSAWLARKYPDDAALAAAWRQGATPRGPSLLGAAHRWQPDALPGNRVEIVPGADATAVELKVVEVDSIRWHTQAYVGGLPLEKDQTYTLEFEVKADTPRPLQVVICRDDPRWRTDKWRTRGLNTPTEIGTEWTPLKFVFVAHSTVDVPSRLSLIVGHKLGSVSVRNLKLSPGAERSGLLSGQSAVAGTVPIPTEPTVAQWRDWIAFLIETEVAYASGMRNFLRDELGVRAPIICTQMNYGGIAGLAREQSMDFADAHYYWQHPDFGGPTHSWNREFWATLNTPQLAEFEDRWFGEIGALAQLRVSGKPFSVSEIDHPFPHDFGSEMYPTIATYGGLQDWDALYPFDMVEGADPEPNSGAKTFFDQHRNPGRWGFAAFATTAFRNGLVPPAPSAKELRVGAPVWSEEAHVDVLWLRHLPGRPIGFLTDRLSVSDRPTGVGEPARIVQTGTPALTTIRMECAPQGPVYVVSAERAATATGFIGGAKIDAGALRVECARFGLDFAAVTAVALDGAKLAESHRVLVTLVGRTENPGMVWDAVRKSVNDRWGHGPMTAEPVPATITLVGAAGAKAKVYALAPDGSRAKRVEAKAEAGALVFTASAADRTIHYEIVRE